MAAKQRKGRSKFKHWWESLLFCKVRIALSKKTLTSFCRCNLETFYKRIFAGTWKKSREGLRVCKSPHKLSHCEKSLLIAGHPVSRLMPPAHRYFGISVRYRSISVPNRVPTLFRYRTVSGLGFYSGTGFAGCRTVRQLQKLYKGGKVYTLHGNTVRGIYPASPNSAAYEVKFVFWCWKTGLRIRIRVWPGFNRVSGSGFRILIFFRCKCFQFLVIKTLDLDWTRIGIQPKMLDPDPYTDPQPWL